MKTNIRLSKPTGAHPKDASFELKSPTNMTLSERLLMIEIELLDFIVQPSPESKVVLL